MYLIIVGPPGVGKGTQAKLLCDYYNILHISTGDIFRENFKNNTKLGKLAKEYVDKGELVPDSLTNDIVKDRLSKDDIKKGFLLDGYPRNIDQVKFLEQVLKERNFFISAIIDINVKDEVVIKRISGRRVCPKCGTVYNIYSNNSKKDGVCDNDNELLIQREDDKEKTVKNRLTVYKKQTAPIIDYYEKLDHKINVNGDQEIEEVNKEIIKKLGELK